MSLYKEVYVKYGIGQTLINTASLYIFGDNYFSIYLTANIFYFFSIFFILLICLKLRFNYLESLFLIIILININPKLIMPWANYLAFLPIVLSLYFQLLEDKKINYFLSGTFLALSCLIRETILISALIIQNLHAVEIFRVSTGSILGILVLNYYLIKILKKNLIKYIDIYIIIVVSIYLNSYGTWGHETDNKKFYELSFNNIKSNFNNIFKTEKMNNYVEIKEFGIMNYDSSIHNFFADFKQKCTELVKVKGIKYSINHGNAWELNYYCGTRPAHYYLFPAKKFAEIYKDAKHIKKIIITMPIQLNSFCLMSLI
jgi:hypothetical protein